MDQAAGNSFGHRGINAYADDSSYDDGESDDCGSSHSYSSSWASSLDSSEGGSYEGLVASSVTDDMAQLTMQMMRDHAAQVGAVLAERAALIKSILWLSQHLPQCVLASLSEEISILERSGKVDSHSRKPPPKIQYKRDRRPSICNSVATKTSDITDADNFDVGLPESSPNPSGRDRRFEHDHHSQNGENSDLSDHSNPDGHGSGPKRRNSEFLDPFPDNSSEEDTNNITTFGNRRTCEIPSKIKRSRSGRSDQNRVSNSSREESNHRDNSRENDRQGGYYTNDGSATDDSEDHYGENGTYDRGFHREITLPYSTHHESAILFVDISGFTKLSLALDVESLSKTMNSYFEMIVSEATSHGGDVLKFAGDAIFVEWQSAVPTDHFYHDEGSRSRSHASSAWHGMSLQECVAVAAHCGAKIVQKCSHFPIYAPAGHGAGDLVHGAQVGTLNVHCGLAVGDVAAVHVGDDRNRREFLIVGDPIDQVAEAEAVASLGEVVASPQVLAVLAETCDLDDTVLSTPSGRPAVIAAANQTYFHPKRRKRSRFLAGESHTTAKPADNLVVQCENLDLPALRRLRQLISLYVHTVVVEDELAEEEVHTATTTPQKRHQAEAELRSIYVIFIMPMITARLTGDMKKDEELFDLLNKILLVTTRHLEHYCGHLRQFIVDDKGVVLIATFGLRGSTVPNMISERALPATTAIHNALQVELDVDNQIGATFGKAYCGVVGGIKRHEYAVLGPSVNLSARLMTSPHNPGILVDNAVRLKADKSFTFDALPPVKAKGYEEPVPIFEPLSANEKRWGKVRRDFVGRKKEVAEFVSLARDVAFGVAAPKLVFLSADSGSGKSCLLVQAIGRIRKMAAQNRKKTVITRNVSNEGDKMIPFSLCRSTFKDILRELDGQRDYSMRSAASGYESSRAEDLSAYTGIDSHSSGSIMGSASIASSALDRLSMVMRELGASDEYIDIVGHHLLGLNALGCPSKTNNSVNLDMIVDFMSRAFVRCTQHVALVVMALDDVHLMDELSWKVLQGIFNIGKNLLIICASRPLKTYKLSVDEGFWNELHTRHARRKRFIQMSVPPLELFDMRLLMARKLGCKESEIDNSLSTDLHKRSGGMPHFAAEILETIKRKDMVTKLDNGKIGWRQNESTEKMPELVFCSVGELVVHRMDTLDATVRKLLSLCAVLGSEFRLSELILIYRKWLKLEEDERLAHAKSTKAALDTAVSEGILEEVLEGGDQENEAKAVNKCTTSYCNDSFAKYVHEMDRSYRFCHDMWKSNMLDVMLGERKRDMHRIIAQGLEADFDKDKKNEDDICALIKLYGHWKQAGDTSKAAALALSTGKLFEHLGLHRQGINMYDETLDMWSMSNGEEEDEMIGVFTAEMLDSIGVTDLEHIVHLHIAKGKCLANIHEARESVDAYQDALSILKATPAAEELSDRSIVFPIFSGLFVLLKFGKIEQDDECTYEQDLVKRFVRETELHGDPVHHTRALAMQADVLARLGKFKEATLVHHRLSRVYDASKHSAGICESYGSDRSAQSYSACALWYWLLGEETKASEKCNFVLRELLPRMDLKNVHNTMVLLFPVIVIMKDRGEALRMKDMFTKYVVDKFNEYYEAGFTFFLPIYKPLSVLLDVCSWKEPVDDLEDKISWILKDGNTMFTDVMDSSLASLGMAASSVVAEICCTLSNWAFDVDTKRNLVRKGLKAARKCERFLDPGDGVINMMVAFKQNSRLLEILERLAREFGVADDT